MNALTQVFMFILMLSVGDATQTPKLGARARHSGHKALLRKEAVHIDSASVVQHIKSAASKERSSRRSALHGKIEQGGFCLAARRADLDDPDKDGLEFVDCHTSATLDDEEWEAGSVDVAGKIELAETEEHDLHLCLEADLEYTFVKLKPCETDTAAETYEHQLFTYDNVTNEIEIDTESDGTKCVTKHGTRLKLEACTHKSKQEFVFEQSHHSLPTPSGTTLTGKIKHSDTNKCIVAHKTSTDAEDLEVVDCDGDGDDDLTWVADAAIKTSHNSHSAQRVKLEDSTGDGLCLTADSAFEEVELKRCHSHTHHHRQMWIYEDEEFKITNPKNGEVMCMSTEPEEDNVAQEPEDNLILIACTGSSDEEWEWELDDESS